MFLKMFFGGLFAALAAGVANAAVEQNFNWNVTNLTLLVLPLGAFLLGMGGGAGAGVFVNVRADRSRELLYLGLTGTLAGLAAVTTFYYAGYVALISQHPDLGHVAFHEYLNVLFQNLSLSAGPSDTRLALGQWGVVAGWLDFVGAPLGGFGGAGLAASWRRQRAGVTAIPEWINDVAAILSELIYADGRVDAEEVEMARKMLMAQASEHYEKKEEGDESDLREFVVNLIVEKLTQARDTQFDVDRHLDALATASPLAKNITLSSAAYVSLCDGELDPREWALIEKIAARLGFNKEQRDNAVGNAYAHLQRIRQQEAVQGARAEGDAPGVERAV
jgi:tellurite resistance protein/fluoride ion exporter CrcB/FEX